MKKKSVPCSDWMLGWGYGGYNKLGTLTKDGENYLWKGKSSGRHGQVWWTGAKILFKYDPEMGVIILSRNKGSLPVDSEVIKAINELECV